MAYNVLSTPVLVIDEVIKVKGRIATVEEIKSFLRLSFTMEIRKSVEICPPPPTSDRKGRCVDVGEDEVQELPRCTQHFTYPLSEFEERFRKFPKTVK